MSETGRLGYLVIFLSFLLPLLKKKCWRRVGGRGEGIYQFRLRLLDRRPSRGDQSSRAAAACPAGDLDPDLLGLPSVWEEIQAPF